MLIKPFDRIIISVAIITIISIAPFIQTSLSKRDE